MKALLLQSSTTIDKEFEATNFSLALEYFNRPTTVFSDTVEPDIIDLEGYDIVFVDQSAYNFNGLEALITLKSLALSTDIYFVLAKSRQFDRFERVAAIESDIETYSKPYLTKSIIKKLKSLDIGIAWTQKYLSQDSGNR